MTRKNNFDVVRLFLALTVVFTHAYELSMNAALISLPRFFSARLAVEGFFAISGFLIFASFERSKTLQQYVSNRTWRILPGYCLSLLLCIAITFFWGGYHAGPNPLIGAFFDNVFHPGKPGVFASNPGDGSTNGALWTIKVEVLFYLCVPVLVWLGRRIPRDPLLVCVFLGGTVFHVIFAGDPKLLKQLPGQLPFFMVGALVYYHFEFFKRNGRWLMLAAGLLFGLHAVTGWFWARPISVSLLILGACLLLPHIAGPTRWGDFSYGTYVLHYPILQLLVAAGFFQFRAWRPLLLSLVIVAAMAVFSWFMVEKPLLLRAKSGSLRRAAIGVAAAYPPAVP